MDHKLTYKAKPEIVDDQIVCIREELNGRFSHLVVDTREKAIRDGLIALGWTPPTPTGNGEG